MGKIVKLVYHSAIIVLVVVFFVMILNGDESTGSGLGLNLSYVLSGICGVAAIISSGLFIYNNPAKAKKLVFGAGFLILLSVLCYVLSPGNIGPDYAKFGVDTVSASKSIDMGLYVSLFLTLAAVAAIVVSEAISLIKH